MEVIDVRRDTVVTKRVLKCWFCRVTSRVHAKWRAEGTGVVFNY